MPRTVPYRALVAAVTWVSVMLMVGLVALWIRGYWRSDMIDVVRPTTAIEVYSGKGGFYLAGGVGGWPRAAWEQQKRAHPAGLLAFRYVAERDPELYGEPPSGAQSCVELLGFGLAHAIGGKGVDASDSSSCWAPAWGVVLVLGTLLVAVLDRFAQPVRRRRLGECVRCGYDLRCTPTACPECGELK